MSRTLHMYICGNGRLDSLRAILDDHGMERLGKKAELVSRIVQRMMTMYQVPGRHAYDRFCRSVLRHVYFSRRLLEQPAFPIKHFSEPTVSFHDLCAQSIGAGCPFTLYPGMQRLRDLTPPIVAGIAFNHWFTLDLSLPPDRPSNLSWRIFFSKPPLAKHFERSCGRYCIRINGIEVSSLRLLIPARSSMLYIHACRGCTSTAARRSTSQARLAI